MSKGDYEVGYGKPPRHGQFPKGQSGNPGGKTAGTRGLKTDLADELNAKHTIQVNGKAVTGTRQRLAVRTLAIRAASGDLKAQQLFFATVLQVLGVEDRGVAKEQMSAADRALLAELLDEQDKSDREEKEEDVSGTGDDDHDGNDAMPGDKE